MRIVFASTRLSNTIHQSYGFHGESYTIAWGHQIPSNRRKTTSLAWELQPSSSNIDTAIRMGNIWEVEIHAAELYDRSAYASTCNHSIPMPLFYSLQLLSLGSIGSETAHDSQAMIKLNPSAPASASNVNATR